MCNSGERLAVAEDGGVSIAWDYDDLYRLESETRTGGSAPGSTSFTYDKVGNRLTETRGGVTTHYTYNPLDQLQGMCDTEWNGTACSSYDVAYSYDARGNLQQVTEGAQVTQFTFDGADRLASVTLPNATVASYAYDHEGRRVRQAVNGTPTTGYLWDPYSAYGDVVLESDGSGTPVVSYQLAEGQLISQTRGSTTHYYLPDGQGSTRALTNESGTVTDTYHYDAFGELAAQTGSTANTYLHTGQQFDSLTGLYSLRARYYDPGAGRFLSRDAAAVLYSNPIELNRYGYVANNPINLIDPSGRLAEWSLGHIPSMALKAAAVVVGVAVVVRVAHLVRHLDLDVLVQPRVVPSGDTVVSENPFQMTPEWERQPTLAPFPMPTIDPPTATHPPTITPTPTPQPKHITLGHQITALVTFTYQLRQHLKTSEVYYYEQWYEARLTTVSDIQGAGFNQGFAEATNLALQIHVNLDGISDPYTYAQTYGSSGVFPPAKGQLWTAIELYLVKNNGLCGKTRFYRGGGTWGQLREVPDELLAFCSAGTPTSTAIP